MASPALGRPYTLYQSPPNWASSLPAIIVDASKAGVFTLDLRGAAGTLVLETIQHADGSGAAALPYALSDGGPAVAAGTLTYTGGERLFITQGCRLVRITGTVTSGRLTLVYTGWPASPPAGAAVPMNVAQDGMPVSGINRLPVDLPQVP